MRSVQLIRAPQVGSAAEFSAPLPPPTACPCPPRMIGLSGRSRVSDRSGSRTLAGPTLGPARHGPARVTSCDIPGHGIMVAKPGGHDSVTKLRSSSCASVPACLPTQTCPLSGVCRCARAPREEGGGQGLRDLAQRSPTPSANWCCEIKCTIL